VGPRDSGFRLAHLRLIAWRDTPILGKPLGMAIRHGLAGQFAKNEARKRTQWSFLVFSFAHLIGIAAACFACGFFWSQWGQLFGLLALVLVAGALWCIRQWVDGLFEAGARERIKYLRGGQSEAYVAWVLEDLEDDWHVFNGIKLEAGSDVDHVVVGPGGVYCISTKSARGWFVGTPDGLLHNQHSSPFARDAVRQAANLGERLKAALGADVPWVQAVLALPFGYIDADACGGRVWLAHADSLIRRIAPERGTRKLDKAQVTRIVRVLEMIAETAAEIYRRPVVERAGG